MHAKAQRAMLLVAKFRVLLAFRDKKTYVRSFYPDWGLELSGHLVDFLLYLELKYERSERVIGSFFLRPGDPSSRPIHVCVARHYLMQNILRLSLDYANSDAFLTDILTLVTRNIEVNGG